ncbi:MAG: CinA family protein [Bacteroidia bacterium]|jgi:nicotinamide-nucleotide amidase
MHAEINAFVKTLQQKKLTLALAESVTCGMATHKLATCKGTSEVLAGSVICYTPEVKKKLLKVPAATIDKCTCESKQVTEILSRNLAKLIKADIHAAITGLAAKGGSETKEKPVGTIFFSVSYKNKTYGFRRLFRGSPQTIKEKACLELYRSILKVI